MSLRPAICGLLPHPPIVVPAVGGDRLDACRATVAACREFARRLVEADPDRLLLVSPHSPRRPDACGIWAGKRLRGDLGAFRAPGAAVDLPHDPELADELGRSARARGVRTWDIPPAQLDHGAVVPLWFLQDAGWSGRTTIVSLPYPGGADLRAFGAALGAALGRLGGSPALVASGDMSHRCLPGAPAGYHPRAAEFDREIVRRVDAGRLDQIDDVDPELRELAAEDVVDSSLVAAAALGFQPHGHEVLSYEHPFGVGYMVAVFHDGRAGGGLEALPAVAREAVAAALERRAARTLPQPQGVLAQRAPVFVTLRRRSDGSLRGCIGSLEAMCEHLVAETANRARAAALEDKRFPPVRAEELADLRFEVSVLSAFMEVQTMEELEPRSYGVVVSDGVDRRGVLLPGIEGVDTAAEQVEIARRKAGIAAGALLRLQRFRVHKVEEP